MAGKQSQANKNFWYAYALWQQKVAQALARRRAEALARKRQALLTSSSSQPVNPVLALLAKLIPTAQKVVKLATIGMAMASLLMLAGSVVQDGAEGGVYPQGGVGLVGGGDFEIGQPCLRGLGYETSGCDIGGLISVGLRQAQETLKRYAEITARLAQEYGPYILRAGRVVATEAIQTQTATQTDEDENTEDEIYYFRGTTEGYLGNPNTIASGITSTTTQPAVATVFATVAETMYGGEGVVYIFSANNLANILPSNGNVLSHLEFEVGFNILPNDLEKLAMLKITDEEARAILATMGFNPIDSRIEIDYQNTVLRDLVPLTRSQISEFVLLAGGMGGLP